MVLLGVTRVLLGIHRPLLAGCKQKHFFFKCSDHLFRFLLIGENLGNGHPLTLEIHSELFGCCKTKTNKKLVSVAP